MSTKTTNLNLDKPEMTDTPNITMPQLANNFDVIDTSLAQKATMYQQDTEPADAKEGDFWIDESDNIYQGTVFDSLNNQVNSVNASLGDLTTLDTLNRGSIVNALNDKKVSDEINFVWNADYIVKLMGVTIDSPLVVRLDGLYFRGNNIGNKGQKKAIITSNIAANMTTDLDAGVEQASNWYGVFLVQDSNGNIKMKYASFLRVLSDSGNVINFSTHLDKTTAKDYGFAVNDLQGCQFIVLSNDTTEVNVGAVRNVTASTSNGLTYDGASLGLAQGSFIMIAPKGYTNYKYIGCVYNDSSSNILNFVKSGKKYDSLGLTFLSGGTASAYTQIDVGGNVPPTARAIKLRMYALSISSPTAGGNFGVYVAVDGSSHLTLQMMGVTQNIATQQSMSNVGYILPRYPYQIWYQKIGTNTASVNLQVYGWEE